MEKSWYMFMSHHHNAGKNHKKTVASSNV